MFIIRIQYRQGSAKLTSLQALIVHGETYIRDMVKMDLWYMRIPEPRGVIVQDSEGGRVTCMWDVDVFFDRKAVR